MDGYMCPGSELKDAVFDYVSDIRKRAAKTSLFYINSKIIPYGGSLDAYVRDLTPASFASAGGDHANTDLRRILADILAAQGHDTVSIFVSDCILDIPENANDFFGNCQVSVKNTFNDALRRNPRLGVEIMKMQSRFDGWWYCGHNKERLSGVKRPYYIWVIGDRSLLAEINRWAPATEIIGGIQEYCAFSPKATIPFDIDKKTYRVSRADQISVNLLADLSLSLQDERVCRNAANWQSEHPSQVSVAEITPVTAAGSRYTHQVTLDISSPKTLHEETLAFTYPELPGWVEASNDDTGKNPRKHLGQTTGLLYLLRGVAAAYRDETHWGQVAFRVRNR